MAWLLMLIQGVRRLSESYLYRSHSASKMWIGHYLLGLLFYLTINIAVWIEDDLSFCGGIPQCSKTVVEPYDVWPVIILIFHGLQHTYHASFYRLRTENSTYQMPNHHLFSDVLCPHYSCEVIIYLLLSRLASPAGHEVNWTLASATILVAVNLGVTAVGTWDWYLQRFGPEKLKGKKRMIPGIW